nr:hypothetical protein [Tanacetum cinerariifolium]
WVKWKPDKEEAGIQLQAEEYDLMAMQMVGGNSGNQFRQYAGQNARNPAGYNDVIRNQVIQNAVQNPVQNPRVHNVGNQIGNGIQLQAEEYDLMAAAADLDEIKEVNANCILMANLQQASNSGTQTDSAPVYDTDGSAEFSTIEADDQAIQTILLGLPEDIYAAEKKAKLFNEWERFTSNEGNRLSLTIISRHVTIVHQTKDLNTADYTQLYDFLKYNQKEVDELKAERLVKTQDPLALIANSNNPYAFPVPHQDRSSFNHNYLQQPMPNPEDITDPRTAMNMVLALMAKAFKPNYSKPTNNNQRISSNLRNRQIAQPGMNMGQDRQTKMVRGNGANQFRQYAG